MIRVIRTSKLGPKLVRITALVLAIIMVTGIVWSIYSERKQAERELLEQSRVLAVQILALREVTAENQHLINYNSAGSFEFKHLNPAAYTQQVGRVFNAGTKYRIRQISLNPRLKENAPDTYEKAMLLKFKGNSALDEAWLEKVSDGEGYFQYLIPLRVEPACLACHGQPKGETDISGSPKEGYQIGNLIGALAISIPTKSKEVSLNRTILQSITLTVLAILFSAVVIIFHTNRFISQPVANLNRFTEEVGLGNFEFEPARFQAYGEIKELTIRFTEMAVCLREMYNNLEQKVLERTWELAEANNELNRISQYKSEFLASMSHELRTPLTAILAFTEGLLNKSKGQLAPQQEDYLKEIKDSGKHLLGLINDLLDLAKIESCKMSLDLAEVDLNSVVERVEKMLQPLADKKGVALKLNLSAEQRVIADEEKAGQVIRNLLSNALKFSPAGTTVEVIVRDAEGYPGGGADLEEVLGNASREEGVLVTVRDYGPGIDKKDLELIFESFYQANNHLAGELRGTGLGLALCKKIIDLHLGWLKVESKPGEGAAFTVFWPTYPPFDDNIE